MPYARWAVTKQMKKSIRRFLTIILLWASTLFANAQITGIVLDAQTGDTIAYPSASYKGSSIAVSGNSAGVFSVERHNGWYLTISAVGYVSQRILIKSSTPHSLTFRLKTDTHQLDEVVVKSKRKKKYSRKNNPAVELMQRVIAAKKRTHLNNHDYYQYNKYQKLTLAVNDIKPEELESTRFKKSPWLIEQVETCPYNNKLILPISIDETVIQHVYRKNPRSEKDIIKGQSTTGVNQIIETGSILNTMMKDIFTDVDIYDDQVRLLQYPFTSPIGKDAVAFYKFFIEDTVYVDKDKCYHLQFAPNNLQDFGFRGELYILADSTLHVKRCLLTIPTRSDVNFVENMQIQQDYTQLPNGEWVLSSDDLMVELKINNLLSKAIVLRTTRLTDYAFDELPKKLFRGKAKERYEADAKLRDENFWQRYRTVELTKSESSMDAFIHRMEQTKGFKYLLFGLKALIENFVETGTERTKSKFDIGPINTLISKSFVDGIRLRASGQTTASLNSHWFWKGYYAYGTKTRDHYYSSLVTYSFNKKEYQPTEFPIRTLSIETAYDVMSPSDKFLMTDKDNVFTAIRWQKVEQMYFYNRQKLKFDWETDGGFRTTAALKLESNRPTGELVFNRLSDGLSIQKIRTAEASIGLFYAPGKTYINTKQHRFPVNLDAPEFNLSHTMGFKGVFGGQYRYNYTEASFYKRFWMNSWGKIDTYVKGGVQWNKVPFPLLIMPASNLSYFIHDGTFSVMGNMEFLTDRFVTLDIGWDLSGKLLNRIPLVKKLKWREFIGIKGLWGTLTDKNNPFLPQNTADKTLFLFPSGTRIINSKEPYWEMTIGVHNVFKFFSIDYVRRLSYTSHMTGKREGIRFKFEMTF